MSQLHKNNSSKNILITGAASGLGRAFVLRLVEAEKDANFILIDLNEEGVRDLRSTLPIDRKIELISGDVSSADQWIKLSHINVSDLYLCAGAISIGEIGTVSLTDWDWIINVNLKGTLYAVNTFIESVKAQKGSVTIVASRAAFSSAPQMGPYNITKAALVSFGETLFNEVEDYGVSVVIACPSYFKSNLAQKIRAVTDVQAKVAKKMIEESPKSAEEIVEGILKSHEKKELYYVPRGEDQFLWRLKRFFPIKTLRMVRKKYHKALGNV